MLVTDGQHFALRRSFMKMFAEMRRSGNYAGSFKAAFYKAFIFCKSACLNTGESAPRLAG
jgi:hypothetical protein